MGKQDWAETTTVSKTKSQTPLNPICFHNLRKVRKWTIVTLGGLSERFLSCKNSLLRQGYSCENSLVTKLWGLGISVKQTGEEGGKQ